MSDRVLCALHGLPLYPMVDGFCSDKAAAAWNRADNQPTCFEATFPKKVGPFCRAMAEYHGIPRGCKRVAGHPGNHAGFSSASEVMWTDDECCEWHADEYRDSRYGDPQP